MTDLDALTARAETWLSDYECDVSTDGRAANDAQPLIRDLLTYATTVSQERDEAQGACLEWDALHRKERQRADHAEQERDAAIARAEHAEARLKMLGQGPSYGW